MPAARNSLESDVNILMCRSETGTTTAPQASPSAPHSSRWAPMDTMTYRRITMEPNKKIALVAHDHKKRDLVEWALYNRDLLAHHKLYATGTTGGLLERVLNVP